ncbi:MAG: flagellin [Planctomycetota bacterium]
MLSILSNPLELAARHSLSRNQYSLLEVMKQLTTGERINAGKDDPAGLIASEHLKAEIRSLQAETSSLHRAGFNANIAEGHMHGLSTLYGDLQSLVVASANDAGMSDAERAANQLQIDSIVTSIQKFTGDAVSTVDRLSLPGTGNADVTARLEASAQAAATLASGGANDLSSGNLYAAQAAVDQAITDVARARGGVGAYQRYTVEPVIRSNQVAVENLTASNSRIRDTDYAKATSLRNQMQILTTANIMTLKIAQDQSRSVLSLLRGV